MIAGTQKITNKHNDKIVDNFTYSDNWEFCGIVSVEALALLQLVVYICEVVVHLIRDSIIIYSDNLKLVRRYSGKISKSSIRAKEEMLSVIEIKQLISKIRIRVLIEYASKKLKDPFTFQSNLPSFSIYQYNQRVNKIRLLVENGK